MKIATAILLTTFIGGDISNVNDDEKLDISNNVATKVALPAIATQINAIAAENSARAVIRNEIMERIDKIFESEFDDKLVESDSSTSDTQIPEGE